MTGNQDIKDASKTYDGFLNMLKWGSIATAIVTIFVILIIS